MIVSEAVAGRRSIRAFLDRPVPLDMIRECVARAGRAPSGGNLQPWNIHVLTGAPLTALKDDVAQAIESNGLFGEAPAYQIYPQDLGSPYSDRREQVGEAMYRRLGIAREDRSARRAWFTSNFRFFNAPCGLFCHVDRAMGPPQWSDLGMYLQTLMLLLREQGLDSCAQECWALFPGIVARHADPAPGQMLFAGMAIGYADPDAPINDFVAPRVDVADFARFSGFPK